MENEFENLEIIEDMELVVKPTPESKIKIMDDGFKYTDEDLTVDGLFTKKANMRRLEYLDSLYPIETNENTERIQMTKRVIMLCLNQMGLDVMTNTYSLSDKQRKALQNLMHNYDDIDPELIKLEFNAMVNDEIFNGKRDLSKVPIFK